MTKRRTTARCWCFRSIFEHADGVDVLLMVMGFIGAVGDGLGTPTRLYVISRFTNDIGNTITVSPDLRALRHSINQNAILLCYFAAASWLACFIEGYSWTRTAERQASRMRRRYLRAVLRQEVSYFDINNTTLSDVITSVSTDTLTIQYCISEKVPNFLMNMATFVGSYVAAFVMLWRLAIVGFPFVILLVIPGMIYGRTLMGLARKCRDEYSRAGSIAEQAISCVKTVYAFVGETKTMEKFTEALERTVKLGLKQGFIKGLAMGSNGITYAIYGFCCWYGSKLVMYHGAQGGTVDAVGATIVIGGLAFGVGLSNLKYFSEAAAAGERIEEMIKKVPKIDSESMEGLTLENVSGQIELKHVEFAYPSRPEDMVLKNLSLQIPAGKTVALVGESGCGKSTVVCLLQRYYDPIFGEILLDGVPIHRLQVKWLRSQMGLVSQEPSLFATTIKENILFGKEDATMEQVVEAAKASNAHNFICQLPQGYDTQVGERGAQMSGGQKQRIAIARAIIKKPQILLLDESTSALDSESERVVQEALEKVSLGRTTLIIAHRLSTIRHADTIAVIQNGRIVETGSHPELTQLKDGFYSSLHIGSSQQVEIITPRANSIIDMPLTRSSSSNLHHDSATQLTNEEVKGKKKQVPSFKRLLGLNSPEWKQALLGCLSAMLFGAVQPVYALVSASMITVYFLEDHEEMKRKTRVYSLCFVGLTIFTFIVNIGQHYSFAYMGEYLTKRVRERMLSKMLTFEVGWFDQDENSTGSLCSRLAKDANVVRSLVGDRISLLLEAFSAVIVAITMGLVISWRLAIFIISIQPLITICYYTRRVLLKSMSQRAIKAQAQSSKLAAEAVSNHRTITSFSSQPKILSMLDATQKDLHNISQSWLTGFGLGLAQCITTLSLSLEFWYAGKLLAQGQINAKELFETFLILVFTGRVIADAGSMTSDLAKGSEAVASIFEVLDRGTQIEPENPSGHQPEKLLTGHVEFCSVEFVYPTRPNVMILKDFSIDIAAGKSTALVGPSGSGKSTIVSLIERFYDPTKGVIKIDGHDMRSYSLRSLRKHIALVSQEPTLFAGTIRENIVYGSDMDDTDEWEIIEAAKAGNAHEFISGLKDGYDTWCGDKGVQLSGGQKQRIAIARAIMKKPAILLLDEATSALDGRSEKVVMEALESIMVGRTSVVVAHKLSSIQNCDVIVVLDKGKVVEKGTHSSLLAKGPIGDYYSLFSLQGNP